MTLICLGEETNTWSVMFSDHGGMRRNFIKHIRMTDKSISLSGERVRRIIYNIYCIYIRFRHLSMQLSLCYMFVQLSLY